jgi:hypothetical protein
MRYHDLMSFFPKSELDGDDKHESIHFLGVDGDIFTFDAARG